MGIVRPLNKPLYFIWPDITQTVKDWARQGDSEGKTVEWGQRSPLNPSSFRMLGDPASRYTLPLWHSMRCRWLDLRGFEHPTAGEPSRTSGRDTFLSVHCVHFYPTGL